MIRECTKCFEVKDITEYHNLKGGPGGKNKVCKKCVNNYNKECRKQMKADQRDAKLMKYFSYKITLIKKQDQAKFPEYVNTLTVEDLLDVYKKHDGTCTYSNKRLESSSNASIYNKVSFDRIDNNLPHEKSNLQLTSVFMNMMRGNRTDTEFREYIKSCT